MAERDSFEAETMFAQPSAPRTAGQRLRAAREAAGKDVPELALETRITQRHIESIEAGEWSALPGRPYALGFARSLARALGLDERDIADQVRVELDARTDSQPVRTVQQFEVGDPAKTPGGATIWLAAAAALVVIVAGAFFWRSYYSPAGELPPLVGNERPAIAAKAAAPRPGQPLAAQPAAAASGPVVFTALADAVWIKFYDGTGKQLMQKQMAKGESYTVPADAADPKVWTGRPEAFAITVGGRPVPPLADHQTIVKDVPVSAAALAARPPATASATALATPASPSVMTSPSSTTTM